MTVYVDACVVGAGPAGLSAAAILAAHRLDVVVVDEQPSAGGQYYRGVSDAVAAVAGIHRPAGPTLINRCREAGARFLLGTTVWGIGHDARTLLIWSSEGGVDEITARHVLVATGASERSLPFPGWTSPRVVTVGYAQHLASEGVAVGARVLVAGSGPFLLPVSCSLIARGAKVLAVLEAGHPYRPDAGALRHPARVAEFLGYRARLVAARVPVRSGRRVVSAVDDGTGVVVTDNTGSRYDADALCVGYGFRSQVDLLRLLGARTAPDPLSGDEIAIAGADGSTSAPGLWAAGEVTGIAGASAALAAGEVVAAGVLATEGIALDATAARRRLATAVSIATMLAARYPSASDLALDAVEGLDDDTVVCRCEAVPAGAIRSAVADGLGTIDGVKAATRAGMGPCQGRECAPALAAMCRSATSAFTARMPLRPVPLDAIAQGPQS